MNPQIDRNVEAWEKNGENIMYNILETHFYLFADPYIALYFHILVVNQLTLEPHFNACWTEPFPRKVRSVEALEKWRKITSTCNWKVSDFNG